MKILVACVLAMSAWAQQPSTRIPRFQDYPVTETFTGTPATPQIVAPMERQYRTRIRNGVQKGWGVWRDGKQQGTPGPNFAGKMIVVQWGCGAPCLLMAMVEAVTGAVYYPPISFRGIGVQNFALPLLTVGLSVSRNANVEFRLNSGLMIVKATPKQNERHPSYTYYFLWQADRWTLLRQTPIREE